MVNWTGDKPKYPVGRCQFCGYDIHTLRGEICPECGKSRLAWVEVECDECHRVAIFGNEDAGKTGSCPFCNEPIDIPAPRRSRLRPGDSIAKTRFSVLSFVVVTVIATIPASVLVGACTAASFGLLTGRKPPPAALIPVIAAALAVGIFVGIRTSYR